MSVRGRARTYGMRLVRYLAPRVGLAVYEPSFEHRAHLDRVEAEYVVDPTPVRDRRATTDYDEETGKRVSVTPEALEDILGTERFRGVRILEVGPKYGFHSLWLDRNLEPAELVFCDFPTDAYLHDEWRHELRCPHRFVYSELAAADDLLAMEPFDLVFFLGVLYHSVHHLPMLGLLNRATRLGGHMLLETTFDPRPDSTIRLRWQTGSGKAKAVPTIDALRVMLAWTGWRNVRWFAGYRPGSSEAVFLCEKTDELVEGTGFSAVVRPHRVEEACPG